MAFNPAEFAARLQALISGFNQQNSNALYANQNYNRTARKALVDMNTQYDKQAPRLVSGFGRRGMNSANVKSGAFSSAMQDFAKDRVSNTGEAQSAIDSTNAQYQGDLGERQAQLKADETVLRTQKDQQIAEDAGQIMQYRAGAYA
jgi:LPS O-antigen subunit length determinant protein (WzzB/FepE family)